MGKYKNFASIAVIPIAILLFVGSWTMPVGANKAEFSHLQAIGTPTIQPDTFDTTLSAEQEAVKNAIQAYFELRYQMFNTLQMNGFDNLVSNSPAAKQFQNLELGKLRVEIRHAKLNRLRYVKYDYSLNFSDISIDATSQTAIVSVIEGHDVVYEISQDIKPEAPFVSSKRNLEHKIVLREEQGKWKIISDDYEDYLWRMLKETGISTDDLLRSTNKQQSSTQTSMGTQKNNAISLPKDESTHTYDRDGAVSYAHKYAISHNPNYFYFTGEVYGGDCTNFVSQAIFEGGNASMAYSTDEGVGTVGWYYTDVNHRASAWVDVTKLHEFITQYWVWPEGPEGSEVSQNEASPGDLIQMDWTNDGTWDHSVIIVRSEDDGHGNQLHWVAGHSDDVDDQPLTTYITDNPNMVYRFIKIERIDISAARGFDSNGIMASYYNDTPPNTIQIEVPIYWDTFTNFVLSRFEPYIAFDTGSSSPATNVNGTFWSSHWDGALLVHQDGNYTFYFKNLDDGARIYVDNMNVPVLESWRVQGFHNYQSISIALNAGTHNIRVEFAQGPGSGGGLIVEWSLEHVFREKTGPYSGVTSTPTATPTQTPIPPTSVPPTPGSTSVPTSVPTIVPTLPPQPTPAPCPCFLDWLFGRCSQASVQMFTVALQSLKNTADDLELFYRIRDEILAQTPEGRRFIELYNNYSPEVIQLAQADPSLATEARLLIQLWTPNLQALVDGNGDQSVITTEQKNATKDFANHLSVNGSPELKQAIADILAKHPLDPLVDKTMSKAWAYLNGYQLTWQPPLSAANPYVAQVGRTIPVEFTLTDFQDNFVIDENVKLQVLDNAGNIVIDPVGLGNNPVNGIVIQGNKYHYNLQTKGLSAGIYSLQVFYNSVVSNEPAVWTIQIKAK